MDQIAIIAKELDIKSSQVKKAVELLDDGNTIPFIARYRKEATGELDEDALRSIQERVNYLRNLASRKEEVIRLIDEQGKLTPELEEAINKATILQEVEDLYRPFKQKRKTRASIAKEKGLAPLAQMMLKEEELKEPLEVFVNSFIDEEKGVPDGDAALQGAMDIVAEEVSDDPDIRKFVRELTLKEGLIASKATKQETSPFEMYYEYSEAVAKIPPHRILALNRGEKEEFLNIKIEAPVDKILGLIGKRYIRKENSIWQKYLLLSINDAYKRLIAPSIEREIRNVLTEKGEEQAIKVFGSNLKNLLLQPPIRNKRVLGVDPSYRTGCKLAVVDETGKMEEVGVVYPHAPQNKWDEAKKAIKEIVAKFEIDIIAIGNGTASRETEALIAQLIKEIDREIYYLIVSEAGASVYSASPLAKTEFPELDLSMRSAISIARRLQDPLAELVKIEPKAIGVGQYQHDVNPKALDESLTGVVESAVNTVGVDLNTASASLLQYVSGLKANVAKNIITYREKIGKFKNRAELKKVPRLGEQTFIQCSGFLRLPDGDNPLENTPVHPESYELAEKILAMKGFQKEDLKTEKLIAIKQELSELQAGKVAEQLGAGVPTVKDIVEALQKPGRDPREELPKPIFRQDVTTLENLKPGMVLKGTVRNVVDFGAFIDIGVKQDGLVHISQISEKYVKHPMEVVSVGDIVNVKVLDVDLKRERISLTMKEVIA